eukprot:6138722-Pleurochrysis_carterae.AAC.1
MRCKQTSQKLPLCNNLGGCGFLSMLALRRRSGWGSSWRWTIVAVTVRAVAWGGRRPRRMVGPKGMLKML